MSLSSEVARLAEITEKQGERILILELALMEEDKRAAEAESQIEELEADLNQLRRQHQHLLDTPRATPRSELRMQASLSGDCPICHNAALRNVMLPKCYGCNGTPCPGICPHSSARDDS